MIVGLVDYNKYYSEVSTNRRHGHIKTWTGRPVAHLIRTVEDREKWLKIVCDTSNPRPEDG